MNPSLKKLTLSGLLAASLFAGTTTRTIDTALASGIGLLPVSMIASYLTVTSTKGLVYHLMGKHTNNNVAVGVIGLPVMLISTKMLVHKNYTLFKHALSSPQRKNQFE